MKIRWVERRVKNPTGPDTTKLVLQSQQNAASPWVDVPVVDEVEGTVLRIRRESTDR